MKAALLITTYNRPEYLKECLESILRSDTSVLNEILIVDDYSSDTKTIELIKDFCRKKNASWVSSNKNQGIKNSLLFGCELLFGNGNDLVINLDGDALVRNDFACRLLESHDEDYTLTGFHCTTKNSDGSERHRIISSFNSLCYLKESVGGINMCFSKKMYYGFLKQSLLNPGNWDHEFCKAVGGVLCLKESVIQHIGFVSSMGHHNDIPDVADNFKPLHLMGVTLVGVDCDKTLEYCGRDIKFENVLSLPKMPSKADYNKFMLKELYKFINTDHFLIVQNDGYIANWKAWKWRWLLFDYIGAPWKWYKDNLNVGNGGFSLRSKRLHYILGTDNKIKPENDGLIKNFEEDHNICRIYRKYLELTYDINFATVEIAEEFSIEGYPTRVQYNGQFGFHGYNVLNLPI